MTLCKALQLLPQPLLHSPLGWTPGAVGTERACHRWSVSAQSTCYKCHAGMSVPEPDKKPQQQVKQKSRGGTLTLRHGHLLQSPPKPLKKHQESPSPEILLHPMSSPASGQLQLTPLQQGEGGREAWEKWGRMHWRTSPTQYQLMASS